MNKYKFFKKTFDLIFSVLFLLVSSPILFFTCIFIKISSPGSILFAQERIGLNGKPFNLYKFRTMHSNKKSNNWSSTTTANDPRVFRFGWFLRISKIDEFPQFINIIKGEMSLIGPRPTVQEDYDLMNNIQKERNKVLPGLTGLAQVKGGTKLLWPEKIEYDLKYIKNRSIILDLKIIFQTCLLFILFKVSTDPEKSKEW